MTKFMWKYVKGLKYHIPLQVYEELEIYINDMMNSQMDIVLCIDGKEGCGKSRTARFLGRYIAHRCNVKFGVDNIHFTTKDYIQSSEGGCKFQINVLDETRQALNKKRGMSKSNVFFTNWLSENRDKHQVHILLLPAIHDLDNYIAIWRMSLLIHQYKWHDRKQNNKLVRGFARIYSNNRNLQQVLHNRQRFGYYAYPKESKYHVFFRDIEPFTDEELKAYNSKKARIRAEKYSDFEGKTKKEIVLQKLLTNLKLKNNMSSRELAELTDGEYSHMSIAKLISEGKKEMESKT